MTSTHRISAELDSQLYIIPSVTAAAMTTAPSLPTHTKLRPTNISLAISATLLFLASTAFATSNYKAGADEYATISNGISPDRKLAIATHGEGELGYDKFHLYLFDAAWSILRRMRVVSGGNTSLRAGE